MIQYLEAQLHTERLAFAELKQSRRVLPEVVPYNTLKAHVVELALSACTHMESRTKGIPCRQFQDVRAWVAWIGEHLPHAILQLHHPRSVAALVVHAAWCMEFGDGFPFAKCLVRLLDCTRHGRVPDFAFPRRAPLVAMQFLGLSAADCGKAAELHGQLLMSIAKSAPRGMPAIASED